MYILLAMVAGIGIGYFVNVYLAGKPKETVDSVLQPFSLLADIFLRLVKMIIAPLVFSTLVVGVAKQGSVQSVGRIGGKTFLWFICFSFISLMLGMVLVNFFRPGSAMHLPLPEAGGSVVAHAALSLKDFISHIFPTSIIDAMAKNEILQVVVFSLFFGVATAAVGEKGAIVVTFLDSVAHIILKVTAYIMNFAPLAVLGAMAAVIGRQGLGILSTYSLFMGEFYLGLVILVLILLKIPRK
jgi:Na+/H+-dicarboxylate symporter